ncbi:MAG TPA: FAD-containing oxidoreductase [Terriglobales bacterium]|jgi:pyruvate/2-oxoglutarate dehydrogenase complex dihydrolipoamide dehydrogenase (E3) component|nr:FAD-containing oxidoreductase [Terriglobales bacterium]
MSKTYDAIIIGTGQSGPFLAIRMAKAGRRVAIIERGLFGGTCVNTGCIPTKTLVASARVAYVARRAAEFGVNTGPIMVDMKRVKARKDEIQRPSQAGAEQRLRDQPNIDIYRGQAHFEGPHTVAVSDDRLTAEQIFINVGGRAIVPPIRGLDQIPYLDNSSMMHVDFLPEHLIVVGGSYIGLEFGQMYRRFGSKVTILQRESRLIPREDEDISDEIKNIMKREGITVRLNATCITLDKRGDQIVAGVDCSRDPSPVIGSHVLVATGRRPNTDDLGLENAGIAHDEHGYITVDDQLRTNVPGVWAVGDCNGQGGFTHTSYNDFEIVAGNLLDNDPRRLSDRIHAYALYVDPPLGRAGMTETEVRKSGRKALIGRYAMANVGRAHERSETQGFMKVLVDADTKQILGAAILGVEGDEVIHSLLDIMYAKAPYTVISRAMHIHPTVSELVPTMLQDLKPLP